MVSLDLAVSILRRVSNDLSVFVDGRDIPDDTLDYFILSLEFVYREMIALEATYQLIAEQCEASEIIRNSLSTLRSLRYQRSIAENNWADQIHPVLIASVGRPPFRCAATDKCKVTCYQGDIVCNKLVYEKRKEELILRVQ